MAVLWLDIETFSPVSISHGAFRYAEEAEVLIVAHAWDDEPVEVVDVSGEGEWEAFAPELQRMIDDADEVVIHNSAFERTVLRECGVMLPVGKITDTMVLALLHSLPGALGTLCDVLDVPQDKAKDKEGKKLIQLFTKPLPKNRKLRRATRDTHPEEWRASLEYARRDVDAMRYVLHKLPRWNDTSDECVLWYIDQAANDRGFRVDGELARSALRSFERTPGTLAAAARVLTPSFHELDL